MNFLVFGLKKVFKLLGYYTLWKVIVKEPRNATQNIENENSEIDYRQLIGEGLLNLQTQAKISAKAARTKLSEDFSDPFLRANLRKNKSRMTLTIALLIIAQSNESKRPFLFQISTGFVNGLQIWFRSRLRCQQLFVLLFDLHLSSVLESID